VTADGKGVRQRAHARATAREGAKALQEKTARKAAQAARGYADAKGGKGTVKITARSQVACIVP
jgi:hypothetical protein